MLLLLLFDLFLFLLGGALEAGGFPTSPQCLDSSSWGCKEALVGGDIKPFRRLLHCLRYWKGHRTWLGWRVWCQTLDWGLVGWHRASGFLGGGGPEVFEALVKLGFDFVWGMASDGCNGPGVELACREIVNEVLNWFATFLDVHHESEHDHLIGCHGGRQTIQFQEEVFDLGE